MNGTISSVCRIVNCFFFFISIKSTPTEPEPDFLHDVSLEVCMKYYNCPKCKRIFLISAHFKHHIKAHVNSVNRIFFFILATQNLTKFQFNLFRRRGSINCPESKSNGHSLKWRWRRRDFECYLNQQIEQRTESSILIN